jgi:hypothetical protein
MIYSADHIIYDNVIEEAISKNTWTEYREVLLKKGLSEEWIDDEKTYTMYHKDYIEGTFNLIKYIIEIKEE